MYKAYITRINELRPHSSADRLQVATVFGNNVVVGLDVKLGDLAIYFPCDGQLSPEYAEYNNLVRKKDEFGNNIGGYMDPDKRNVKAISLRGERSDGILASLDSLAFLGDVSGLAAGMAMDEFNGHQFCCKYIPRRNPQKSNSATGAAKKVKRNIFPTFKEHVDTAQLAYNVGQFKEGDYCVATLKMHGTSGRTGYLEKIIKAKPNFFQKLFKKEVADTKEYEYISGTRRVVLDNMANVGYYETNDFRMKWHRFFEGKLQKGETVYYEIVGAVSENSLIMAQCDNKLLKKFLSKEDYTSFIKEYGDNTVYSYGCDVSKGENDIYVYRMTMTNEDGYIVEYPWDLVKIRCEQMGVKHVMELDRFIINDPQDVILHAERHFDGRDPIGQNHIREGCVIRVNNSDSFKAFKHKNYRFKVLEGIIKENAVEPDIEEAQEL